jgi:NAD(P)-dependent dehydrogenase (short-subunit alcohol dehydrogenase family)
VSVEAWAPLAGKTAVVTGGASGIGAEIVRLFATAGAHGVVLDRTVAGALPETWTGVEADVKDEAAVAAAFASLDRIDVLVAAAGIVPGWRTTTHVDLAEWDEVHAVNVRGIAATLLHAAPLLADGGSIVLFGSVNSWKGDPNQIAYTASKHAVLGIVRSVARDLGRRGIRVNAVAPGPITTDAMLGRMRHRAETGGTPVDEALVMLGRQTALGRIATTDDVARATLFLASDLSSGVTGHLLPVDAGIQ